MALLLAEACGSKHVEPKPFPLGDLVGALVTSADRQAEPWRCNAIDVPPLADEELKFGDATWKASGTALTRDEKDGGGELIIGVVADAGGDEPRTIAALGRLRAQLEAAKPGVVIALGGMGQTRAELEATLGTLADKATWPVVALAGDLEPESAQVEAIANLRKRGEVVLDGRQVRTIATRTATIRTLPGAGAPERLVAANDGCSWSAEDVAAAYTALTTQKGLRILATAEAPRETAAGGEAAGELALVPSKAQPVDIVLHGPLQPVPSKYRSGGRDGEGVPLSPGTADATTRLPGAHVSSAGVLVIRGEAWVWRPLVDAK